MTKVVQLQVDDRGLIKHMRFAFTRPSTVLSELMQNARRAGATAVDITYDREARKLTVSDDGCGVGDFQNLLHAARSGWDEKVKAEESPYGLGALASLYAAEHVRIESNGEYLDASCADLLDFKAAHIGRLDEQKVQGTTVTLTGITLDNLESDARCFAQGYAIPVRLNGVELPRPHARDGGRHFIDTPIGAMAITGLEEGTLGTDEIVVYLQGHRVYSGGFPSRATPNVIHLDATQFFGRLPDRDCLVDQLAAIERVNQEIALRWRARLEEVKTEMSGCGFVQNRYRDLRAWKALDLLNDIPWLPTLVAHRVATSPTLDPYDRAYISPLSAPMHRDVIESGQVKLWTLDDCASSTVHTAFYAYMTEAIIVDRDGLHPQHWVHDHVRSIASDDITVYPLGRCQFAIYQGCWIADVDVIACDLVRIEGPNGVALSEEALYTTGFVALGPNRPAVEADTDSDEMGVVLVPRTGAGGEVVRQISDFIGEYDVVDEAALEGEAAHFSRFIRALDDRNAAKVLAEVLRRGELRAYQNLAGKTFSVMITDDGHAKVKWVRGRKVRKAVA